MNLRSIILNKVTASKLIFLTVALTVLVIFSLKLPVLTGPSPPVAKQGVLDLTEWDFETDGSISLNGEWEFHWKQLLDPEDFPKNRMSAAGEWFVVPNAWDSYQLGSNTLPRNGYATYRLVIKTGNSGGSYGFKVPRIDTAYRFWINGKEIAVVGKPGRDAASVKAVLMSQPLFYQAEAGELQIIIQASDFHWHKGGIIEPIKMGSQKQISEDWNLQTGYELFLAGGILLMSLYHLGLFLLRRQEHFNFYFGAFCFFVSLRLLMSGTAYLAIIIPVLYNTNIAFRIVIPCILLAIPSLFSYFGALYQDEINPLYPRISRVVGLISTIVFLLLPTNLGWPILPLNLFFLVLICGYLFVRLLQAVKNKKVASRWFFFGFLVLSVSISNDILISFGLIQTRTLTSFGLFILIASQAFVLSRQYLETYRNIELLSEENQTMNKTLNEHNLKLEQQVQDRTLKLYQSLESAEKAKKAAEHANRTKDVFLANISHELRTPMQGIVGFSDLGLKSPGKISGQKARFYFSEILNSSKRLMPLLDNLLDLSKLEFGKEHYQFDSMNMAVTVTIALKELNALLREKNISVTLNSENSPRDIVADEAKILQVIINILSNAIKFAGPHSDIQVEIKDLDNEVMLSIRDNGVGIPEKEKESIFEAFIQSSRTDTGAGGTGLGLAICKRIVEDHQGKIWAENNEEDGANFIFKLPHHP